MLNVMETCPCAHWITWHAAGLLIDLRLTPWLDHDLVVPAEELVSKSAHPLEEHRQHKQSISPCLASLSCSPDGNLNNRFSCTKGQKRRGWLGMEEKG